MDTYKVEQRAQGEVVVKNGVTELSVSETVEELNSLVHRIRKEREVLSVIRERGKSQIGTLFSQYQQWKGKR